MQAAAVSAPSRPLDGKDAAESRAAVGLLHTVGTRQDQTSVPRSSGDVKTGGGGTRHATPHLRAQQGSQVLQLHDEHLSLRCHPTATTPAVTGTTRHAAAATPLTQMRPGRTTTSQSHRVGSRRSKQRTCAGAVRFRAGPGWDGMNPLRYQSRRCLHSRSSPAREPAANRGLRNRSLSRSLMYVNLAEGFLLILAALKESRAVAILDLLQLMELNPNEFYDLHGTTRLIMITVNTQCVSGGLTVQSVAHALSHLSSKPPFEGIALLVLFYITVKDESGIRPRPGTFEHPFYSLSTPTSLSPCHYTL